MPRAAGQTKRNYHAEKCANLFGEGSLYAHVYTFFISRKKYSPIHTMLVFFWFTTVSSVKVLISKCSQGQHSIHTGGERLWKVERISLHTGKPPENQQINDKNATVEVNTLKSKPSQSNPLKIKYKKPSCEGVNAFFADKKAYRRVWTYGETAVFQQQNLCIRLTLSSSFASQHSLSKLSYAFDLSSVGCARHNSSKLGSALADTIFSGECVGIQKTWMSSNGWRKPIPLETSAS